MSKYRQKKIKEKSHASIVFIVIYALVLLIIHFNGKPAPEGEWDDYSFPIASIINEFNFTISESDIAYYAELFPDWAQYTPYSVFTGYYAPDGAAIVYYFPLFAIICVPFTLLLKLFGISTLYTFPLANTAILVVALIVSIKMLKLEEKKEMLMLALFSLNPVIFYIDWPSGEVLIYSFLLIGMTAFYKKYYKRAGLFVSLAGALNPTIMFIGIVMIAEYMISFVSRFSKDKDKGGFIKKNILDLLLFACCFIPGLVPMIYNYIYIGHINVTATAFVPKDNIIPTLQRLVAYLFDLNYGIFPYLAVIFVLSIILLVIAIKKKHIRYIVFFVTFLINILLYAIMPHINCGMAGMARYNTWGSIILLVIVGMYYDELIDKEKWKKRVTIAITTGICLSAVIVLGYGPERANATYYIYHTPIAGWVLDNAPALYSPLESTFRSRTIHLDGAYEDQGPVVYVARDGYVRKIMASADDKETILNSYGSENGDNSWLEEQLNKLGENNSYINVSAGRKIRAINTQ